MSVISEKRLTVRLQQYWEGLKKDRTMPEVAQFTQAAIDDIWPNCMLLKINREQAGQMNCYVERVGMQLQTMLGENIEGKILNPKMRVAMHATVLVRKIPDAVTGACVVSDKGQFVSDKSRVVKYRSCLLPFGTASGGVSHILAGISWKEF